MRKRERGRKGKKKGGRKGKKEGREKEIMNCKKHMLFYI